MADNSRVCGCKGIRSCLLCEKKGINCQTAVGEVVGIHYSFCNDCGVAYRESEICHPDHDGTRLQFDGICLVENFVTEQEEQQLVEEICRAPFVLSQSGRRKQDFGPKVNFKRKKLRTDKFSGLPSYAKYLYSRMQQLPELADFQPVELCNLEYASDRGAAIDPHFDDFWLWGERLVTLNMLSSSVLSFTSEKFPGVEVSVPLPRRSLIIVYGDARNVWMHGIHRSNIQGRRIAMTLRELTPEFLDGGPRADEGKSLLEMALTFQGQPVGS